MKKEIKQGVPILTCHDEDCPRCGFPETIDVRNPKTFEVMRRICSKRCGWEIYFSPEKVAISKEVE